MTNKAFVLHTIDDARHFAKNYRQSDTLVFSTHASVDVFLKEKYNINCKCVSGYLDINEIVNLKNIVSDFVDNVIMLLERRISPAINSLYDFNVKWFDASYPYVSKYHLHSYLCFVKAMERVIDQHKLKEIVFYNIRFNEFLSTNTGMEDLARIAFSNMKYEVQNYHENLLNIEKFKRNLFFKTFWYVCRRPSYIIKHMMEILINKFLFILNQQKVPRNRPTIFCDLSYNLKFLNNYLSKKYDLIKFTDVVFQMNSGRGTSLEKIKKIFDKFPLNEIENIANYPVAGLLIKDIRNDFIQNFYSYIHTLEKLKKTNNSHAICVAIAGVPTLDKVEALCLEFIRSQKAKIIFGQHGCLYGEAYETWHFDSDFRRCDIFLSYGITYDDVRRLYPQKQVHAEIHPCGYISTINQKRRQQKIDILFPITSTTSIFNGGMARISPNDLLERQVRLLQYLNEAPDIKTYIKPFQDINLDTFAPLLYMKKLRNLTVIDNRSLIKFLEQFSPKAVLIEFPSQPLTETIGLDVEIFLMGNAVIPYEKQALDALKKRVHYSEDVEEMINMIDSFFKGKVKQKRDETFFKHYVFREHAKENIVNKIENIISSVNNSMYDEKRRFS